MSSRIHHHATAAATGRLPLLRVFFALFGIARERRQLAQLDDHMLRDIGLSRAEADAEAARGSWDAPAHWLDGRGKRT